MKHVTFACLDRQDISQPTQQIGLLSCPKDEARLSLLNAKSHRAVLTTSRFDRSAPRVFSTLPHSESPCPVSVTRQRCFSVSEGNRHYKRYVYCCAHPYQGQTGLYRHPPRVPQNAEKQDRRNGHLKAKPQSESRAAADPSRHQHDGETEPGRSV